jgi:uncharacterized LabA/DUF88 family protein
MSAPGRDTATASRINQHHRRRAQTVSKNVAVFVDVANLYYSARGQEVDVDYVALLKAATKGRDLIRAYAYSGLDPENENQRKFIDFLNKNGYKVVHKDIRKFGDGRVKANLDIELVVDLFRLANRMDIAVIVSGDGDFAPAIRALQDVGVRCEVISFRPNTSSDLIAVADEFIDIMKIASIGRAEKKAAAKGMSAPEMPAKEVVPEFGFREASPGVAAAALAALREGGNEARSSRGRGRTRTRTQAPAAEEAPAVATVGGNGETPTTDEGRRRRRRRGGRGRGRGGRGAEAPAAASGDAAEIGWTELDDLSQLEELADVGPLPADGDEEREYTFEEADEATLAELGLLDSDTASLPEPVAVEEPAAEPAKPARRSRRKADTAAAADAEPAAKPARRSRTRKGDADAAAPAAESSSEAEEKPKPRRRTSSTTRKATAKPKTSEEAGAKPARRTRSRKAATEETAGASGDSAEGESQGIWQRFRSARGGGSSN